MKKSKGDFKTFLNLPSVRVHVLARLSERFSEQMYQREFGLSLLECRMIGITGAFGHVTFKRVCEEANLDKSHASRLINRLIKRRLLKKVSNPADQRSVLLTLSSSGRRSREAMHACATALAEEWLSVLSVDARRIFEESLVKLTDQIRAMSEAESQRKGRRPKKHARVKGAAEPAPRRQVIVDRRTARHLFEILESALGGGTGNAGR